jgi:dienelactone hydrolase
VIPKGITLMHATDLHFTTSSTSKGVLEREFTLADVPGVLWTPASGAVPAPLVLMGHPGGLHKQAPGVVARAAHLVTMIGYAVAVIDAPGHGHRPRSADDAAWVEQIRRARAAGEPLGAIVSAFNGELAERAVPEWRATLDALDALPDIDADRPVGYTGLTLGAEIGMRLVAAEPRIGASLVGAAFASEELLAVARRITVPTQYLLPWDDDEIDRASGLALFEALGSTEKTLHATSGSHRKVPWFETEDSARFFARHLLSPADESTVQHHGTRMDR